MGVKASRQPEAGRTELHFRADASKVGHQHRAGSCELKCVFILCICTNKAAAASALAPPALMYRHPRTEGGIGAAPKGVGCRESTLTDTAHLFKLVFLRL